MAGFINLVGKTRAGGDRHGEGLTEVERVPSEEKALGLG